MPHPVIIGEGDSEKAFSSKKEATEFFREMLARYRNNQTIGEADEQMLLGLLERHPEAVMKIGCGVKRFFRAGTGMGTDCFWLERTDGNTTDFSYLTCISGKRKSLYQEFAEACRQAVQPDLDAAKNAYFNEHADRDGRVKCDMTGERVTISEAHLDHKKPMTFEVLVRTFVAANRIEISHDMLSEPQDQQFATTFVDPSIAEQFRSYHKRTADLRIIKARENLRLAGAERITRAKRPVSFS
jgi:hypothetical protein